MIFKKIYLHFQEVKYLHSRLNIDMEILINLWRIQNALEGEIWLNALKSIVKER
jgi:hypothetical protein